MELFLYEQVNARNRVFMILGLLTVGSLIWYFATTRRSGDLQLIGTVDANEVMVSARIPGRIQTLTVKEGDTVKNEQEIGKSGQTGLAGGDHLHFTILLDGIPVNPTEWWDPHWIHDRITAKMQ